MQISVISNHQPTVIVHPTEAAFNDPTPAVSLSHTDGAATTGFAAFSLNGGNGGFDPPSAQPNSKRTAVISFVSHQFLGLCSGTPPPFGGTPNCFRGRLPPTGFHDVGRCPDTDRSAPRFHPTTIMTLVPLSTLVFPIPFPLFWQEQIDHPEKLEPIRFSLPHPFDLTARAKSAPTSRLPTIVSIAANRWWENHIAGAYPPKYNRFSRRREFRSMFFADLRADVRVPVWVWEEEVQSQPIVRLSAHVSYSYFHFTLADHVFEIACRRRRSLKFKIRPVDRSEIFVSGGLARGGIPLEVLVLLDIILEKAVSRT